NFDTLAEALESPTLLRAQIRVVNKRIDALLALDDPHVIEVLLRRLNGPWLDPASPTNTRRGLLLVQAIGTVADQSALVPLLYYLDHTTNMLVREALVQTICGLGDIRAYEPLESWLLVSQNPHIIFQNEMVIILNGLRRLDEERTFQLLQTLLSKRSREHILAALRALVEYGDRARPLLWGTVYHEDRIVCQSALIALAQLRDPRALIPLLAYLEQSEDADAGHIVTGLATLGDRRAVDSIYGYLLRSCFSLDATGSPLIRNFSQLRGAVALAELGDERALSPLSDVLTFGNVTWKIMAATALGKLDNPKAIPALTSVLENAEEELQNVVRNVLIQLGENKTL
ncbi:MAG: HEAT repeat domain-containing protein, partial [Chloroflexota bacterium]